MPHWLLQMKIRHNQDRKGWKKVGQQFIGHTGRHERMHTGICELFVFFNSCLCVWTAQGKAICLILVSAVPVINNLLLHVSALPAGLHVSVSWYTLKHPLPLVFSIWVCQYKWVTVCIKLHSKICGFFYRAACFTDLFPIRGLKVCVKHPVCNYDKQVMLFDMQPEPAQGISKQSGCLGPCDHWRPPKSN